MHTPSFHFTCFSLPSTFLSSQHSSLTEHSCSLLSQDSRWDSPSPSLLSSSLPMVKHCGPARPGIESNSDSLCPLVCIYQCLYVPLFVYPSPVTVCSSVNVFWLLCVLMSLCPSVFVFQRLSIPVTVCPNFALCPSVYVLCVVGSAFVLYIPTLVFLGISIYCSV